MVIRFMEKIDCCLGLEIFAQIPDEDYVLILTARKEDYKLLTEKFLDENGLRYDLILYNMPVGERILINDNKPSGLKMGMSVNKARDEAVGIRIDILNAL